MSVADSINFLSNFCYDDLDNNIKTKNSLDRDQDINTKTKKPSQDCLKARHSLKNLTSLKTKQRK